MQYFLYFFSQNSCTVLNFRLCLQYELYKYFDLLIQKEFLNLLIIYNNQTNTIMRKLTLLTLMTMSLAWNAKAQDSTATATEDKGEFTVSGYVDAYYNFAVNRPFSGTLDGVNGAARPMDKEADQLQLGLIQTKFAYTNSKFDFVGDLAYGPNAAYGNYGNVGSPFGGIPLNSTRSIGDAALAIKQAYGTWKATDKFSITAGQFGTHIGYEVIDAPVNFHYSLSNLFNNGPFYHLGVKANYAISDKVGVMAGIVNGWDAIYDNNKQKSFVGQLYLNPIEDFNIYLNYMGGRELTASAFDPTTYNLNVHITDLTAGYQVSEKFYFGINAAYGIYASPDTAVKAGFEAVSDKSTLDWWGVALYPNYKLNDWLSVGVRYEYYEDTYGIRYHGVPGLTNNSLTLTTPITLANGMFTFKPEVRYDGATQDIYEGSTFSSTGQKTGSIAQKEQLTIGFAGIFKF